MTENKRSRECLSYDMSERARWQSFEIDDLRGGGEIQIEVSKKALCKDNWYAKLLSNNRLVSDGIVLVDE